MAGASWSALARRWGHRLGGDRSDWRWVRDRFLPPFSSSRVPFGVRSAPAEDAFSAQVSVRLACCTHGVAFSRQQVVLPGGQAYWTVLDECFEVAELFDGFLRWLRLVNGRAESTTRQYGSVRRCGLGGWRYAASSARTQTARRCARQSAIASGTLDASRSSAPIASATSLPACWACSTSAGG